MGKGKATSHENNGKREEIQGAENQIPGERNKHQVLPDIFRQKKIILDDIVIADILGKIQNHKENSGKIQQAGSQKVADGSTSFFLYGKKHYEQNKSGK